MSERESPRSQIDRFVDEYLEVMTGSFGSCQLFHLSQIGVEDDPLSAHARKSFEVTSDLVERASDPAGSVAEEARA